MSPVYLRDDELVVDLFAGGGGASQGLLQATGRHPDIAINHDADAVAVHTRNHPECTHFCQDIWKVRPQDAVKGRRVGLMWVSPTCTHFSRAAGGVPKSKQLRSQPGVVLTWAKVARPRIIFVENVREMRGWGPLLDDGTPCPKRIGRSFNIWLGRLRGLGYQVEMRELCAADYGSPTIRTRLFIVARCDGEKIVWPQPTHHSRPSLFEQPWRTAAECIDWSIPCRSIFDRKRPLKEATLNRIAEGLVRYVINARDPFIVPCGSGFHSTAAAHLAPITHTGSNRGSSLTSPVPTLTCANRGEHALISAWLAQHNGGEIGRDARKPLATITTTAAQIQAVEATLSTQDREGAERVAAFLIQYYGQGKRNQSLREPLGTVVTKGRFALVMVSGVALPIVDISMRMLAVHELKAAQGFPADYDMTDGGRLSKTGQIRLIGNSVCPGVAEAVVRANVRRAPAAPLKAAA